MSRDIFKQIDKTRIDKISKRISDLCNYLGESNIKSFETGTVNDDFVKNFITIRIKLTNNHVQTFKLETNSLALYSWNNDKLVQLDI